MTFSLVESHGSCHCLICPRRKKTNGWMQQAQAHSQRDFQRKSQTEVGVDRVKLKGSGYNQKLHYKWYPSGSAEGGDLLSGWLAFLALFMFSKCSFSKLQMKTLCCLTHCPYLSLGCESELNGTGLVKNE